MKLLLLAVLVTFLVLFLLYNICILVINGAVVIIAARHQHFSRKDTEIF
jgi:fatty acid desaturase